LDENQIEEIDFEVIVEEEEKKCDSENDQALS
jgi:hypothetical protein